MDLDNWPNVVVAFAIGFGLTFFGCFLLRRLPEYLYSLVYMATVAYYRAKNDFPRYGVKHGEGEGQA